jgi:hypothetical protein
MQKLSLAGSAPPLTQAVSHPAPQAHNIGAEKDKNMPEITWSDKMHNRIRTPHLFAKLPGQQWQEFSGQALPGVLAIKSSKYQKNGKWSGTDFVLLAKSAIVAEIITPFDGWGDSWADHARAISIKNGEYDGEQAAREIMPLVGKQSYQDAVNRANQNSEMENTLQ